VGSGVGKVGSGRKFFRLYRRRFLKAVVYQEPFKVTVEEMPDAKIEDANDAVVRITTTNICGSDLHMYEGRTPAEPGMVFGHERTARTATRTRWRPSKGASR